MMESLCQHGGYLLGIFVEVLFGLLGFFYIFYFKQSSF